MSQNTRRAVFGQRRNTMVAPRCFRKFSGQCPGLIGLAARLEQEPGALLGVVNEILKQARRGDVFVLVSDFMRLAHVLDDGFVVVQQFAQQSRAAAPSPHHCRECVAAERYGRSSGASCRRSCGRARQVRRSSPGFPRTGCVEQQVIVAEMRSAHMPMEVLGLQIERETVGEQRIERRGNGAHRVSGRGRLAFLAGRRLVHAVQIA